MLPNQKIFPVYTMIGPHPITICESMDTKAFDFPFFNEGVTLGRPTLSQQNKYELKDIVPIVENDALEIKGFIFHTSHCGSTLLSRMLNTADDIRIVSEPESINGLLLSYVLHDIAKEQIMEQLISIINAYRQPLGSERYVLFKLTSWNIYFASLFLDAFQLVPWVYIDRKTEEVVSSLQLSQGGMESWFHHPVDILRRHFVGADFKGTSIVAYLTRLVEQHRWHAAYFKNEQCCILTYPTFIEDFESVLLPHFRITFTETEFKKIKHQTSNDAKEYLLYANRRKSLGKI